MYVDCHCHLTHDYFKDKLDKVLERAKEEGVREVVTSGVNTASNKKVLELADKYKMVKASAGIYPIDALGLEADETGLARQTEPINLEEEFKFIKENKDKFVVVGEVGLDFHWDKEHHKEQKDNFRKVIKFVEKLGKPILVHSRKAEKECVEMLEGSSVKKVILHTFMGSKKLVKKAVDNGWYFSIPTLIVRLEHFQMVAEMVPLDRLLTETDAPWLSPFRGKKNEPAFVKEVVKKIAEVKEMDKQEVADKVYSNFKSVYQ